MRKNGFVLIELMLVLAIIGILVSVAATGLYNRAIERQQELHTRKSNPADTTTCIGGIAHLHGTVVIVNGNVIRC